VRCTLRSLTLILGLLLLGACGGKLPNGKEEILHFRTPTDLLRSADYAVVVPSHWYGGKGPLDVSYDYDYDFKDTELEATTTGGLSVVSISQVDGDYLLRLRCGAEHGQAGELRVRIKSGRQTRYADAIDLTCWEPDEVTFQTTSPWVTQAEFFGSLKLAFTGGPTRLDLTPQHLDRYFVEFVDPNGPLGFRERPGPHSPQNLNQLLFKTQTAGPTADILLGERRMTLPVEVVADTAWQLRVKLVSTEEVTWPTRRKRHSLSAYAVLPGEKPAMGLTDCLWAVKSGGASEVPTYKTCSAFAYTEGVSGVVCAKTRGKESCVTLPP